MVTNGAGPCVVAADYIYHARFLSLAEINTEDVKKILPSFAICNNPVDLTGSATGEHFLAGMRALENDFHVDIIMLFFVFQDAPLIDTLSSFYSGLSELALTKPVVAVALGGRYVDKQEAALLDYSIPLIRDSQRAINALDTIVQYAGWRM
jgi:3-hydroxypropionyl-CoA synthetase (ADP-forming)